MEILWGGGSGGGDGFWQGKDALAVLDEVIEEHFGGKAGEGRSKAALVEVVKGMMEEKMENMEPSPEWLPEALRVRTSIRLVGESSDLVASIS
jgi:hypothetical protein